MKLKFLREELQQKNRKQNELISQLDTLKNSVADHHNQIFSVLAQVSYLSNTA
jgi:ABC-type transporter Mla subunit MlaD